MRTTFHFTLTLMPGALALACALPPRSVAAQTSPARLDVSTLAAAIEEARGSPFHARNETGASRVPHASGYLPAYSPRDVSQTPVGDDRPSYLKVFAPTLAATYLADFFGFWALVCLAYGGGNRCIDDEATNLALLVTVPVIVPALTVGGITDRFASAFFGSALGTVAAVVSLAVIDPNRPAALIVPAIDAAVTTFVTLALSFGRH